MFNSVALHNRPVVILPVLRIQPSMKAAHGDGFCALHLPGTRIFYFFLGPA